ncbi:NACHT domain-containing protein [Melittangium boletus]|uniref:NACHT domain-containing protein n=1 Tax=Melittangium boletus TaxID=83453 RepID=UPI003DA44091
MALPIIPWQRFWLPRGHPALLRQGYLPEPDPEEAETALPLATLPELLLKKRCVALLGEPGMGKTTTLAQERSAIERHCAQTQTGLLWLNLNAFGSEDRLARALFENEKVAQWRRSTHTLCFVLDSFDECHLRIDTLSTLLRQELEGLPTERLRLFIACRPAHWPEALEQRLRELWPDEAFSEVELAPLRLRDVRALASASQIDPDAFCAEVERRDAAALATRPVTLRFMLEAFKRGGLPVDRWQLYWEGCRFLAQENNPDRRDSRLRGELDAEERLAVASRVAALMLLANREEVWLHPPDEPWPGSTRLDELVGGEERVGPARSVSVSDDALRETLDSGLFGPAGPHRVGWAHRTYAEFLAAHFLSRHEVPRAQLSSLLRHPEDSSQRVVPPLQGVAAWLALKDDTCFALILELDPWILLGGEALAQRPEWSERLVESLLRSLVQSRALGGFEYRKHYARLAHPHLGEQLRRYLRAPQASELVVRHVLNIATACGERALAPDCADIAWDETRPTDIRAQALEFLGKFGGPEDKQRLLPMALRAEHVDAQGYLRGAALTMLWPECLSTDQLFSHLSARGEHPVQTLSGVEDFLRSRLPSAELPRALQWLLDCDAQQEPWAKRFVGDHDFATIGTELLQRAWMHLEAPGVFEPFVAVFWIWLGSHRELIRDKQWAESDTRRWRVLDGLAATRKHSTALSRLEDCLAGPRDFAPLLSRAERASSEDDQRQWASLALKVYSARDPAHRDAWVQAAHRHEVIAQVFSHLSPLDQGPVGANRDNPSSPNEPVPAPSAPFVRACEHLLQRIEGGDVLRWFALVELLMPPGSEETSFLTSAKRWSELPDSLQRRCVGAGRMFLIKCHSRTEPWLEGAPLDWPAACAYWAFFLLGQVQPGELEFLPEAVWRHWTTLVLAAPCLSRDWMQQAAEGGIRGRLIALASRHAPVEVHRGARRLLSHGGKGYAFDSFCLGLHASWRNDLLLQHALETLRDTSLDRAKHDQLLRVLLRHGDPEARRHAESRLTSAQEPSRRIRLAALMLLDDPSGCWRIVWPLIQQDVELGRSVLDEVARKEGVAAIIARVFSLDQLVDLYVWIEQHGGTRDPTGGEGRFDQVMTRHSLQGACWAVFMDAGTSSLVSLCRALDRLHQELPRPLDARVEVALVHAQEALRQASWNPPSPAELLRLLDSRQARVVQSGAQLLDVLLESLARLQEELHGETPALGFLWNEWTQDGRVHLKPKEENDLSDWVKRHLEKDLVDRRLIVNREVEIRATEQARPGQRVDLRVDALARSPEGQEERISVIIEVKGCWNRGTWSAMREQLVERYLAENTCRHGLYLVGWYACSAWDATTYPEEGRVSLERARQVLDRQAQELSRGPTLVRAFVLDAAFREEAIPSRRRR